VSEYPNEKALSRKTHHCSLCGKSEHQVRQIIAAAEFNICNECVELYSAILAEWDQTATAPVKMPLPGNGPTQRYCPAMVLTHGGRDLAVILDVRDYQLLQERQARRQAAPHSEAHGGTGEAGT